MGRLRLLPGERELVRLRPAPAAWLGRYLLAAALAGWALLYLAVEPRVDGAWAHRGLDAALAAGPSLAGVLLYGLRSRFVRLGLCVAVTVATMAALLFAPATLAWATAASFAGSLVGLVLAEVDRRARGYHFTTVRIVHGGGLWDRLGWTIHYDSILDVDLRRSPAGRMLGYGSLDPVLSHPPEVAPPTRRRKNAVRAMEVPHPSKPSVEWVGRPRAVRALLEAFVQDATATDYLRTEQQTQQRVGQAMRALGHVNVVRRR